MRQQSGSERTAQPPNVRKTKLRLSSHGERSCVILWKDRERESERQGERGVVGSVCVSLSFG